MERRRGRDLPFDLQPVPSAATRDLDPDLFRQYLASAVAADVLATNDRSFEERLKALRFSAPDG